MAEHGIMQELIELLLGWMRLVTAWVWDFFQADMGGGFIAWFSHNWIKLALVLIVLGVFIDWLIWMIRWRPYWLWLRKRQIIYEDVAPRRAAKRARAAQAKKDSRASDGGELFDRVCGRKRDRRI